MKYAIVSHFGLADDFQLMLCQVCLEKFVVQSQWFKSQWFKSQLVRLHFVQNHCKIENTESLAPKLHGRSYPVSQIHLVTFNEHRSEFGHVPFVDHERLAQKQIFLYLDQVICHVPTKERDKSKCDILLLP